MNTISSKFRVLSVALLAMGLSACASTVRSTVDVAENVDLSEYKTFAWVSDGPVFSADADDAAIVNPINERRIRAALETELSSKGYVFVPRNQADLVIGYTLGARDRVRVRNHYDTLGYGYYGYYRGFSRFGLGFRRFARFNRFGPGFGYYRPGFSRFDRVPVQTVRTFTEGTLAVDVFDNRRKQAIWHGSASKRIAKDDSGKELIAEAVDSLLEQFPDRADMMEVISKIESST